MADLIPFENNRGNKANPLVTDEAKIKALVSALPSKHEMKQISAAVAAHSARLILLGVLPFKSAGEASKVARDFAAIAKDLDFDMETEEQRKAESREDALDQLEYFRQKAQEKLDGK